LSGGTVSFAFVAGTVATVNPCGFALLPAYLARRVGAEDGTGRSADAVSRALLVGLVTTAGFMLVFGTIGTSIGLGARELTHALPWAGLVIGTALVLAGAAVLLGGHLRLRLPQLGYGRSRGGMQGDVLFGIGYGTASLSCTLPIFLAATGGAVTGSLAGSALSFVAYAAGMGTVLTALAVAAALSQQGLARALRRVVPYVNRGSGALLMLAGAYVVYYWAFFLLPGSDTRTRGRSLINQGESLSSQAATWLSSSTGHTVISALLGLLAALALWALARWVLRAPKKPAETAAAVTAKQPHVVAEAERSQGGPASSNA
jgi:cytochrome c biogenesis protein CcdA